MRLNYQKPWSCRKKQKDQYYNKQIPLGHWEMSFSLREETVIDWLYLLGPMSVPSASLNLSSIQSSSPAMSFQFSPAKTKKEKLQNSSLGKIIEHFTNPIPKPKTEQQTTQTQINPRGNFQISIAKKHKQEKKNDFYSFWLWYVNLYRSFFQGTDPNYDKEEKFRKKKKKKRETLWLQLTRLSLSSKTQIRKLCQVRFFFYYYFHNHTWILLNLTFLPLQIPIYIINKADFYYY